MAAAARKGGTFETLMERVAEGVDRLSGQRLGAYLTPAPGEGSSPFGSFGAVAAAGSKPLPVTKSLRDVAVFTVEEARERLAAFLDGRFVPSSLADLVEYLGERFVRLETRILPGGRSANFLVDTRTSQAVPAAQVDPRLSHAAMLCVQLRGALRQQTGASSPAEAFDSWQGLMLVTGHSSSRTGYTVVAGEGWYGKVHAIATGDREKDADMVRSAREKGIELVLPRESSAKGAGLVKGMPVLVRSKAMKAAAVHPGLAHDKLSLAFGKGMIETFNGIGSGVAAKVAESSDRRDNVVSISEFKKKFVRTEAPRAQVDDGDLGFGGLAGARGSRDLAVRRTTSEKTEFYVFDRDLGEEVPIAVNALPAGRYPRETADGVYEGVTAVLSGGTLHHEDLEGRKVRYVNRPEPAPVKNESFRMK